MNPRAVSAVIIGNEVLTAKVTEANGTLLIRRLRERGVELTSVHLVRDEVDEIVEQLLACRRRSRFVITSGGVGPTHDDVTVRAVALALGRPVVRLPEMEARIRSYYGDKPVPAEALRMAESPAGGTLVPSQDPRFPVLECDGIYMLPGVPQLFRVHLEAVLPLLPGQPRAFGQIFLNVGEADIAARLDAIALEKPKVAIGSYPVWGDGHDYRVRLTVEHESVEEVRAVMASLLTVLGQSAVVRTEGP